MTSKNQSSSSRPPAGRLGFTLVELLLVMALLVIVLAIAAPNLANFFRGRSLDNEARRLLALTRLGQSRAVSEGIPMVLWLDEKGRCYGLEEESGFDELMKTNLVFTLDKDLQMEVVLVNRTSVLGPNSGNSLRTLNPNLAQPTNPHRNYPSIRFLEDGTIGETSPELIRLRGWAEETLCLAQARQHLSATDTRPNVMLRSLGYAIHTRNDQWDESQIYR